MIAELVALVLATADAPPSCYPRERLVAHLAGKFEETAAARGLNADGSLLMEIFTSPAGSWTVVTTGTDGLSCIFAAGKAWMPVEKLPSTPEAPVPQEPAI